MSSFASAQHSPDRLRERCRDAAATSVGTEVWVAGGRQTFWLDAVEVIDLPTQSRQYHTLSLARSQIAAAATATHVVFAGGEVQWGVTANQVTGRVDICELATMTWSTLELPTPDRRAEAGAVGGRVFVFSGDPGAGVVANPEVQILDPVTRTFTIIPLP